MHRSWVRVSHILGWPWTHCVAKDALLVPFLCLPTLGLQMRKSPYFSNAFFFSVRYFQRAHLNQGATTESSSLCTFIWQRDPLDFLKYKLKSFFSSTNRCTNVKFYRPNFVITDLNILCLNSRATHWKLGFLILNHFNLEHVRMIQIKVSQEFRNSYCALIHPLAPKSAWCKVYSYL